MNIKELKRELQSRKDALENMKLEDYFNEEFYIIVRDAHIKRIQELENLLNIK